MNIKEILTIWPPTNPHWANEVGTSFFAEDKDLDTDGWLDPWSRPLDKEKLILQKRKTTEGWTVRTTTVTLEGKNDVVNIKLAVYTTP